MELHINFLHIHTKNIKQLTNELLHLQDIAEVTADADDAEELSKALEELKTVVDNLPLA
jgi:hypothetical protein